MYLRVDYFGGEVAMPWIDVLQAIGIYVIEIEFKLN